MAVPSVTQEFWFTFILYVLRLLCVTLSSGFVCTLVTFVDGVVQQLLLGQWDHHTLQCASFYGEVRPFSS